jgi:N-acetylglucosamine-1-phosphodiester alpha-N-acetylglucosaminidase
VKAICVQGLGSGQLGPGGGEWCLVRGTRQSQEASQSTDWVISQATSPGSFSKFVNVMSARTAVGHDRKGQLVLFHADGQTEQRG